MLSSKEQQQVPKKPYLGTDDFSKLASPGCLFVDKTGFIPAYIRSKDETILITRYRRDGKSSLMRMVETFLTNHPNEIEKNKGLFEGTVVSEDTNFCAEYQGQYPAIFITLKDASANSMQICLGRLKIMMQQLFGDYRYLLESPHLSIEDKDVFRKYYTGKVDEAELAESLKFLSRFLSQHFNKNVFILIDEYDAPINQAYTKLLTERDPSARIEIKDYCENLIDFFKSFFGATFKTNKFLEKGLMMGILRISKNEMLSSLNNLRTYGVLDARYAEYFGFTEAEVIKALHESGTDMDKLNDIRLWYNGYTHGSHILYNPWSVMNFIADGGTPRAYWLRTGSIDKTVQHVMLDSDEDTRSKVRALIGQSEPITVEVPDSVIFEDFVEGDPRSKARSLWALLLSSGYLTAVSVRQSSEDSYVCQVKIPNNEVRAHFVTILSRWMERRLNYNNFSLALRALCIGDVQTFAEDFGKYILKSASLRDFEAEADYQALMIGLLYTLHTEYDIKSNIEIGLGYPDFTLLPVPQYSHSTLGIVLELKHLSKERRPKELVARKDRLVELAKDDALAQVEEKQYGVLFKDYPHIKKVLKVGISFSGKMMVCAYRMNGINELTAETDISLCYGFNEKGLREAKPKMKQKKKRALSDESFVAESEEGSKEEDAVLESSLKRAKQAPILEAVTFEPDEEMLIEAENSGEAVSRKRERSSPARDAGKVGIFKSAKLSGDISNEQEDGDSPEYK